MYANILIKIFDVIMIYLSIFAEVLETQGQSINIIKTQNLLTSIEEGDSSIYNYVIKLVTTCKLFQYTEPLGTTLMAIED